MPIHLTLRLSKPHTFIRYSMFGVGQTARESFRSWAFIFLPITSANENEHEDDITNH